MNEQPAIASGGITRDQIFVIRPRHRAILNVTMLTFILSMRAPMSNATLIFQGMLAAIALLVWARVRRERKRFEADQGITRAVVVADPGPIEVRAPSH